MAQSVAHTSVGQERIGIPATAGVTPHLRSSFPCKYRSRFPVLRSLCFQRLPDKRFAGSRRRSPHHRKRHRPFAAGTIPLLAGPMVAIVFLIGSFMFAGFVAHFPCRPPQLLHSHYGLLFAIQAHRHVGCRSVVTPLHLPNLPDCGRPYRTFVLAAGVFDVHLPQPGDDQALHRTAGGAKSWQGQGQRSWL